MTAECGTMRGAAERLFLSQPTLSHNIKKLEGDLGCRLFSRAGKQLRLTPYGEVVLKWAHEINDDFKAMAAEVEDLKRREEATLRIGSYSSIASGFVMSPVAAEFPESRFVVDNCPTDALKAGLADGRFDVPPTCNLITSLIMGFVRTSEMRSIVEIGEPYAKRDIGMLYRSDAPEKVRVFVDHMKSHASGVFSGNAFVPYFLFPDDVSNLHIQEP